MTQARFFGNQSFLISAGIFLTHSPRRGINFNFFVDDKVHRSICFSYGFTSLLRGPGFLEIQAPFFLTKFHPRIENLFWIKFNHPIIE